MYVLRCRKSGLDCGYIIKGDTKEGFLKNGANYAIQKHGMHADDIYLNDIPVNLLCHSFWEESRKSTLNQLRTSKMQATTEDRM
ncbi:MAG: DUF1059 domain-containing protein [Nitrososphaeraceae archaeon]